MSSLKGIELFQLLDWKCSMKKAIFTNFAIFAEKQLCWSLFLIELPTFRSNTGVLRMLLNWLYRKWLFGNLFLVSRFQNHPDIVILQKYQSLSKKCFKHNPGHMPFLYLTPTSSLKPSLSRMFISNG